MLASGKLSRQQMKHSNGGADIGTEFSGYVVSLLHTWQHLSPFYLHCGTIVLLVETCT